AVAAVESSQTGLRAAEAEQQARDDLAKLADARRAAGRTDRLAVLAAEADVLVAATELTRARLAEARALIGLAQTLGGDWAAPAPTLASLP
ncbi:MAG: TolC family protein, partial [Verrucomicrobia bacterium]|nr:TolC family protein [Verrucomicrobiota bacterium]